MVQPRQAQLQNLGGDLSGSGNNVDVIRLTGTGTPKLVTAQGARITNLATPVNGSDAATKDYVNGILSTPSLGTVLSVGNTTDGYGGIVVSDGDTISSAIGVVTVADNLVVSGTGHFTGDLDTDGNMTVDGKLTVSGAIDPTMLILTAQASVTDANAFWLKSGTRTSYVFRNNTPAQLLEVGEDATEPFISVGAASSARGAIRIKYGSYLTTRDGSGGVDANLIGLDGNVVVVGNADGTGNNKNMQLYTDNSVQISDSSNDYWKFDVYNKLLQFGKNLSGNASITYEAASAIAYTFTVKGQDNNAGSAGKLSLLAGSVLGGSGIGGAVDLYGGVGINNSGGGVTIRGGQANGGGNGGSLTIASGDGYTNSGYVVLATGTGTNGSSGGISITSGYGVTASGNVTISTGFPSAGSAGDITLSASAGIVDGGAISMSTGNGIGGTGGDMNISLGFGLNSEGVNAGRFLVSAGDGYTGGMINMQAGDGLTAVGGLVYLASGNGPSDRDGALQLALGSTVMFDFGIAENVSAPGVWVKKYDILKIGGLIQGPGSGHYRYIDGGRVVMTGSTDAGSFEMFDLWPEG